LIVLTWNIVIVNKVRV